MSAPTKRRPTNKKKERGPYSTSDGTSWRKVFAEDIKKRGEVAVYLRGIRLREGLTQQQLSRKLGKGTFQHHISEMENGKRNISKVMAKSLGKVFHADYRMFL